MTEGIVRTTSETIEQLKRLGVLDDKGRVMEAVIRGKKKKFKSFPKIVFNATQNAEEVSKVEEAISLLNKNNQISIKNMQMVGNIAKVSQFTMVLSGLNLFATVAGFALMNDKLNKVSNKISKVITLQKEIFGIQTVYDINKVVNNYSNMMDCRKTREYYSEKEMVNLVGDIWNALGMLMTVFNKDTSDNRMEVFFSMMSMASMLSASLKYYDEIYYFKHKDVISGDSVWHNDHDKWMATLDSMVSHEFISYIQDFGIFDLDMSTTENDCFYKSYIEQIYGLKQDVEDNQLLITSINDSELFTEYNSSINEEVRKEIREVLTEVGIDPNQFENAIRASAA